MRTFLPSVRDRRRRLEADIAAAAARAFAVFLSCGAPRRHRLCHRRRRRRQSLRPFFLRSRRNVWLAAAARHKVAKRVDEQLAAPLSNAAGSWRQLDGVKRCLS